MELVGPIFEVIKCFGGPIKRCIDQHRKLEENVNDLRRKVNDLNVRKRDLELTKEAEIRCRRVVKEEVEKWFEDVQRINTEVDKIEEKFRVASYFSRARLGKLVCRKIEEVDKIYLKGSFPEGLAVDGPPAAGLTLPTTNLEGEVDVKERIWDCLMDDEVGMIGVCGMGGIGKTTIMKHINNQLLREDSQFENVIWVTVSKELNIFKLQEDIAESLKESLPKTDELRRAATLMNILEKKRFVLILDDVWKQFSLLHLGIPAPISGTGRKVVLTGRSIEICERMECKVVKVQPLSEEESKSIFLDHVGRNVLQMNEELGEIINQIVEECGGLPLAIVTIASSLKGVNELCLWRNARNELRERVKSVKGTDKEIFERLKFSYDRLEGPPEIQNCFLYCSLYPEDFPIEIDELIENWIDEGFLDGFKTRQEMYDRGHSIINKLQNNCLLERDMDKVKVHDVLRDMALYIKSEGPQFMVEAGMQLGELPGEEEWIVDLEKVSLMHNSIFGEISIHITPICPHLSTLLLQENRRLKSIPDSFFEHMPGLKVLNLSYTWVKVLPESISNLKNLVALILAYCEELRYLPSLAKLRGLRKLDLFRTGIEEVPHGIDMLENLTYLRLFSLNLKRLPVGILAKMCDHLQYLIMGVQNLTGEEVGKLKKLETVLCSFRDLQQFEIYAKSIQGEWPANFIFIVGDFSFQGTLHHLHVVNVKILKRDVEFVKCEMEKLDHGVVPNKLSTFYIKECDDFKCLSHISLFHKAPELKRCEIKQCKGIEYVVDLSLSSCNALQNIKELFLEGLDNLVELVRGKAGVAVAVESTSQYAPSPPAIFSSLKELELRRCSRIKKLFPNKLLQHLQNLEKILVFECENLEKIIAWDEEDEENHKGEGTTVILPKLESFCLKTLLKLKSICSSGLMIQADSLRSVEIISCPKLKRIPFALPLLQNGEQSPPPCLEKILVLSEWWESLEWDQPYAKDVLSPFVCIQQKIVIRVSMHGSKCRTKALKIAAAAEGVTSVALHGPEKDKLMIQGEGIDAVCLTICLRKKVGHAVLESIQ